MDTPLNSPEARQEILKARAASGIPLALAALAAEFDVSADTIRRDLQALEARGLVQRVRGGALPVLRPAGTVLERMESGQAVCAAIAAATLPLIEDGMVLMLDGGTTVLGLAQALPPLPRSLVVTPAPAVALATLAAGIPTMLIGGRLSASGGIAVGHAAERALDGIAADLCCLGACGLDPGFGLSADDIEEAAVKQAMLAASRTNAVLTGAAKLGRRARHRVAPCDRLQILVTDAPDAATAPLRAAGMEIRHA